MLSVKRIVANGGKVLFSPSNAVIVTQNGTEVALRQVGNLYELRNGGRYPNSGGRIEAPRIAYGDSPEIVF